MDKELALLHEKVDLLTSQMKVLTDQAEIQQRRNQDFDELKGDLIPIGNQLIQISIDELAEIGTEFELEDLLYLLKRVLRNTQLILAMMDRFEALMGIADEVELLGKQVFSTTVETLDRLEQEGFFSIFEDLTRALQAFNAPRDPNESPPSTFVLLKEINRPEVRSGLSRLLQVVKALGDTPQDND